MSDSEKLTFETRQLDICGCCEDALLETSLDAAQPRLFNRPGLSALRYRIGTHASFLQHMLIRLSREIIPGGLNQGARPLAALTTRAKDDPAVALLDASAVVADVLTFYQERIANEGYIRTATERFSALELARAIGYELSPGVAAGTFLAFTVEDAPGAPGKAKIPKGTQIQSIPPQGKLPQTFETMEELSAVKEWNELIPRLTRPQELALKGDPDGNNLYMLDTIDALPEGTPAVSNELLYPVGSNENLAELGPNAEVPAVKINQIYLKGTSTNLKAGGLLLFVGEKGSQTKAMVRPITRVATEEKLDRTCIELGPHENPPAFVLKAIPLMSAIATSVGFNAVEVRRNVLRQSWKERDLRAFMSINRWEAGNLLTHVSAPGKAAEPVTSLGVFAFRQKVGFFGHNAPRYETLPKPENTRGDNANDPYKLQNWDTSPPAIWKNSQGTDYVDAHVYLERVVPEISSGGWVIFEATSGGATTRNAYQVESVNEASLVDFGISGKSTGLCLKDAEGGSLNKPDSFKVRKTTAYVQSEQLELAELPVEDYLEEESEGKKVGTGRLMLDRLVLGLQMGQPVALKGEQMDASGVTRSEVVLLDDIIHHKGHTTLYFRKRLKYRYVRKTVKLNANVVRATHGETVAAEVLGSGSGFLANQRFELKKPPLTYISAPTTSGSMSTLAVRVNEVLWREAQSLYGLDAISQNYIVRIDNDGRAMVTFGDGRSGARLPTGIENVVAVYRSGIGPDGEVEADSLTLLKTRPLGIRGVTNPIPASGAEAPETLEKARVNAPFKVLTLDRIVSLQDFEDFARAFAGVGKAQAVALWSGEKRIVHITVAAANGDEIDRDSDLYNNLRDAINAARDPVQEFQVASFERRFFNMVASVVIDSRYITARVMEDIEKSLREAFSFDKRLFGQPVTAAEVITVIHETKGVIAVDLDDLYLVTESGDSARPPASVLQAGIARWEDGEIQPAEFLLINPVGIKLEERKP